MLGWLQSMIEQAPDVFFWPLGCRQVFTTPHTQEILITIQYEWPLICLWSCKQPFIHAPVNNPARLISSPSQTSVELFWPFIGALSGVNRCFLIHISLGKASKHVPLNFFFLNIWKICKVNQYFTKNPLYRQKIHSKYG